MEALEEVINIQGDQIHLYSSPDLPGWGPRRMVRTQIIAADCPAGVVPCSVEVQSPVCILLHMSEPSQAQDQDCRGDFLSYLRSWGGDWMWETVKWDEDNLE